MHQAEEEDWAAWVACKEEEEFMCWWMTEEEQILHEKTQVKPSLPVSVPAAGSGEDMKGGKSE